MDLSKDFENLKENLKDKKNILLVSHESPDRDAIGSMVSLKMILNQLGFSNISMLNETKSSVTEGFVPEMENIKYEKLEDNLEGIDMILVVDTNSWHRITKSQKEVNIPKIVIDHHSSDLEIENVVQYIKFNYSSNCEGLFHLFKDRIELTKEIAKPLLMGIYDDTGGFKYRGTNEETLQSVIELIKAGVDMSEIAVESNTISLKIMEIGKQILKNIVFDSEKKFFYGYIDRSNVTQDDLGDTEVDLAKDIFIGMILNVKEIDWGFIVKPKPNGTCTVSFRSKAGSKYDAVELAVSFGGGGHKQAAGATVKDQDPEKVMKLVLEKLPT